jgi:hypothetical protein
MKTLSFNLYRYQILPKNRYFQGALFGDIQTVEDLIEKKNDLFYEQIKKISEWRGKRSTIIGKLLLEKDNLFVFKFAPKRTTKIENEDFEEEQYENYPSILVIIWNDSSKQIIAIQDRKQAFSSTKSVVNTITNTINNMLGFKQLKVYVEPIFHSEAFWNVIKQYPSQLKNIQFELITPNMANISQTLSEDLKNLAKGTNTSKTKLEIDADDSLLHIDQSDKQINSLVNYASEGGGKISIKISGIQKRIQTANSIKTLEIEELSFETHSLEDTLSLIKRVIDDEE